MGNHFCYCMRDKPDPPYHRDFINQGSSQPVYNTTDVYVQEPIPNTRKHLASKRRNKLPGDLSNDVSDFSSTKEKYEDVNENKTAQTNKENYLSTKEENNIKSSDKVQGPHEPSSNNRDKESHPNDNNPYNHLPGKNDNIPKNSNYLKKDETTTAIQTLTVEELNVIENLDKILNEASIFILKIEQFTELENSNEHYYIEESLSRLVERLDNMHEQMQGNRLLIEKRKAVYKFIFSLFDKFDEKVKINKESIRT